VKWFTTWRKCTLKLTKKLITLLAALGIESKDKRRIARVAGVGEDALAFWEKNRLLPSEPELRRLAAACGISPLAVKLRMGIIDEQVSAILCSRADEIASLFPNAPVDPIEPSKIEPSFSTPFGSLYRGDCLDVMRKLPSESVKLVFADPPFNLDKQYPSQINDKMREHEYLDWCFQWLDECVRLLKMNGSMFVYNIPKWNVEFARYLSTRLAFRDWIAIDLKGHLPLAGRLYPSHYSLIYFCKGDRPHAFHPDRMPMKGCPSCYADLVDYGGYKSKMNEAGVSLTDVWTDIPLVRHSKYKKREGANELSLKLMDRVIEMATNEGDAVFDPFGGSGTTYAVAELKRRRWTDIEIGPSNGIIERLKTLEDERDHLMRIRENYNHLFTPETEVARFKRGLWTCKSVRIPKNGNHFADLFANEV